MAGNILYLNISLVSSKCLFEVWLFDKGGMDDKIAKTAMRRRIFRKNIPTSNAQQSCIGCICKYKICNKFTLQLKEKISHKVTLYILQTENLAIN